MKKEKKEKVKKEKVKTKIDKSVLFKKVMASFLAIVMVMATFSTVIYYIAISI